MNNLFDFISYIILYLLTKSHINRYFFYTQHNLYICCVLSNVNAYYYCALYMITDHSNDLQVRYSDIKTTKNLYKL